jgi:hypothetical protein
MVIWASNSPSEPRAMQRYLRNSRSEPRLAPSAMFETTEIAARRIWSASPKCSLGGKFSVTR